jgi:uncharacterized membrane protein YhiD involved in acid resistance
LWFTAGIGVAAGVGGLALALVAVAAGLFLLVVRELPPVRRAWRKPYHIASVTVLHAERDGLAGVITPLLTDAHGPVVVQTEASSWPDGRGRWQTTIRLDRHGLAGLVERLQASPATLELTIEGADA